MAVVYDEGRTASLSREGVMVTRTLRVTPYNEVPYVCDLILGGVRLIGGYLFRIPPCRDPQFPWCVAKSIEIEGVGAYTGTAPSGINNLIVKASYGEGCRLRVTYETMSSSLDPRDGDFDDPLGPPNLPTGGGVEPSNQQEIDLATVSYDFSAEYQSEDGHGMGLYAAEDDTTPIDSGRVVGSVRKRIPKIDMILTREYVVRVPWTAITECVGTVNKSALTRGRETWPKGVLRFDGLKSARKVTSFGLKFWSISLQFSVRPLKDALASGGKGYVGWQRVYLFKKGLWYFFKSVDTNKFLYEWDEDNTATQSATGSTVGFKLMFHPKAT
jgi:hypothetical protein